MTDYLDFEADLASTAVVDAFDDFTFWSSMFGQLLFRHLPLTPSGISLDIGCGTGFPLLELAERLGPGSAVYGIDSWFHAVRRARFKGLVRGNNNVFVTQGTGANLPYKDDFFDLIVSNLGVNNFAHPSRVMAECHRVCKPGGRIALTTNLVGHMGEFYQVYEQTLIDCGYSHLLESLLNQQSHRATLEGLRALFLEAGFQVTRCHAETFSMVYATGSAFLRAYLTKVGFLDGWRSVLDGSVAEPEFFEELEVRLNRLSQEGGEGLRLSVPGAYIEGRPAR